jgi:hypothetical protein
MATIACFLVVSGGAAYAASHLPKNSVGTKQLKNSSVTGAKVKDGSLLKGDFAAGQLPSGAPGAPGAPGVKGDPGRSALETLRSGESIHGAWAASGVSSSASGVITGVTFPVPAPQEVDSEHAVVAGNDDPGGVCTGTASAPTAAPSFVCVYIAHSQNTGAASGRGARATLSPGGADGSRYGFLIAMAGTGEFFGDGTWAYTAP